MMKWILAILSLISVTTFGQADDTTKYISYPTQYGMKIPRMWAPTTMIMPSGDTTGKRPGKTGAFMTCTCDGNVYRWNGSNWVAFGGSSLSLSNVGSGYRLVTTPNGSIKSIIPGDGQLIDSASTTIAVRRDTTGANGTVTRSEIKDTSNRIRAICQWPAERPLGTILDMSSWVNTGMFTTVGTASLTLNGQYIDISGGNNTFDNYVHFLTPTNLSKWKMTTIVKLTGSLTGSSGLCGGLVHANEFNKYDLTGNISFNNTGSSPIYISNTQGSLYATSGGSISFSQNDRIKIEYEFKDSAFTVTATNLTTAGSPVSVTYTWATPADSISQVRI